MSQINTPNVNLTSQERALLRSIYIKSNSASINDIKAEAKKQGMAPKDLDLALAMLVAQQFVHKQPRLGIPGGHVYAIQLKAMKILRAENAAAKASDRQPALVKA